MKKKLILSLILMIILIPIIVHAEIINTDTIEDILDMAGDFKNYQTTENAFDFFGILAYIKDLFFMEIELLLKKLPVLFSIVILASIKSTNLTLKSNVNKAVDIGMAAVVSLITSEIFSSFFLVAQKMIEELSSFVYLSIPFLTGLLATGGMVVTSIKSLFIILGSVNIITFLINAFYIPLITIFIILSTVSLVLENDILLSLKGAIKSIIKISLPTIIGLFATVLSIFSAVSSKTDELTMKSLKLAVSNFIPFLGSALSESTDTVLTSVSLIKSNVGIISIIALCYIVIVPLLKIITGIIGFLILEVSGGLLSTKNMATYFSEIKVALSMLGGIMGTMAVMLIVSIISLISGG